MTRRVVVRPPARQHLVEAARWYRRRSPSLAEGFRDSIRAAIERVAERPDSFSEIAPGIRRALTRQFPYAVFFAQDGNVIVILEILHQAQDPDQWPAAE